jgi:hypothetical protein
MKRAGNLLPVLLFLFLSGQKLNAQNSLPESSGKAGGPVNYKSLASVDAKTSPVEAPSCLIIKIVEHTYEVTAIAGKNDADINIEPTSNSYPKMDSLSLRIDNYDPEYLSYRVFDYMGNLKCADSTRGFETKIPAQEIASGEYYLKVMYGKRELKTFKIIKN